MILYYVHTGHCYYRYVIILVICFVWWGGLVVLDYV
nr:MAG TPA: hypothetical protein [Caudoviricetes sp.]